MSEEEIIKTIQELEEIYSSPDPFKNDKDYDRAVAIQGLLDLYKKEKEKNKKAVEMLQEHIKYCGQEAIGHFNNIALKFDKHLLQELLEERN